MSDRDASQAVVSRSTAVIVLMILVCVAGIVTSLTLAAHGVLEGYLWWDGSAATAADMARGRTTLLEAMAVGAGATVLLALIRMLVRGRVGTAVWLGLTLCSGAWTTLLLVVGGAIASDMATKAGP
ncbi:hypothetical protein GCM10010988_05250 [Cnuibacter physcomitrellae]|uniref:Uncharacterized protein n=1 Tax=Cnuibacter physcomitrellae TaxID=1619308 RepID=A0A1X9LU04_9MICO|nr:hypothetical protein [Cnuibacter physcomitrellae]ARJ05440.1 hypothetical protein B5808_09545 [Cnuibacter physcomitrellae]GGI35701.1 hypothetical protein GCM10010988_05250 [Cnuibacter physcomitrellae]